MAIPKITWVNDSTPDIDADNLNLISNETYNLSNQADNFGIGAVPFERTGGAKGNCTLTWSDEYNCTLTGSDSTLRAWNLINGLISNYGISAGDKLIINFDVSGTGAGRAKVGIFYYLTDSSSTSGSSYFTSSGVYTVPTGTVKLLVRIETFANDSYNCNIKFSIQRRQGNYTNFESQYAATDTDFLANNTNLNSLQTNGIHILSESNTYTNSPFPTSIRGYLFVYRIGVTVVQLCIAYSVTYNYCYKRILPIGGSWEAWNIINKQDLSSAIVVDGIYSASGSTDLNAMLGNHFYLIDDGSTYTNKPTGFTVGFVMVVKTGIMHLQLAYQFTGGKMWKRRGNRDGSSWEEWVSIAGEGGITNNYTFNEYQNTYNVTATPSITTDTNSYLAPSGDATLRTNDIITMLTQTGVCRLGKGDYYIKNLDMLEGTQIIGSGYATRIICSGTTDGYAIKINSNCSVENCRIVGALNPITVSSTVGGRHGILWQGNYTQDETPAHQPQTAMISKCWIENFTGGGITCYDTGLGTFNQLEVVNVYIKFCNAGINISYWSEFHKFTNVRTPNCYYGCINNGGNNLFVNCDFSTCKLAFLMDNSQSQSPNNSHGSAIGCVFNHTDSNSGIGIKVLNCKQGYIFTGCQIFYSQIYLEDAEGIVISDTNFGETNCNITVDGGGAILFANNMHQSAPTISITDNQNVHFVNCYNRSTGAAIGA